MKLPSLIACIVGLACTADAVGQQPSIRPRTIVIPPARAAAEVPVPASPAAEGVPADVAGDAVATATAEATPDPDKALLEKLTKATFDRRASSQLEHWAQLGSDAPPGPEATAENPPAEPDAQALAIDALTQAVTGGDWPAVGAFFAEQFTDAATAEKGYAFLLTSLSARPKPTPGAPPVPGNLAQFAEGHLLAPADVLGLADAAPGDLDDRRLGLLAGLLRASLAGGHGADGLLDALTAGTAKLGGEDPTKRRHAARLLVDAGLPQLAESLLPEAAGDSPAEELQLRVRYHLGMHGKKPEAGHLASAWGAVQQWLAHPGLELDSKREALTQAVDLAPRVEEELGATWLADSFTSNPERGREILATVGALTARGRIEMDNSARAKRLELQRTAVESLLAAPGAEIDPWREALDLLAHNWLAEAEHSQRYDQDRTLRPQMRWDPFGNMYYDTGVANQPQQTGGRIPPAISSGRVLEAAPTEAWLAALSPSLRPPIEAVSARLYLRADEPEEAFPFIESLAETQPEIGRELASEFLRGWAAKRDPNAANASAYRFGYIYGYNPRANSIPLTRSKQERNLAELAAWVQRIRSLPIEPLEQSELAAAFAKAHSRAEVYRPEAIVEVFGGFDAMEPETVAALADSMRQNLGGVWRDPRVQEAAKTNRKDKDILAEVAAGYETAFGIVDDAQRRHPDHWRLLLARATVAFDWNTFAQENGDAGEFVERRESAFAVFAKAAEHYVADLPEDEDEETTEVYEHWFYAALGASDLAALKESNQPAPAQMVRIKAALEAIPEPAGERHRARFANALSARITSVKPELKQRYLQHGLSIAGDHEKAAGARELFEYYDDLVTEIQLVARIDGPDTVGHGEPFGLFVDIRHTAEIERESGGFGKYLTNQNNMAYAYNYGRPTENYRDKFEEAARAALEEGFEVHSVTFHADKIQSRGAGQPGWRLTPYAYILMRAKEPEVDKIPPLQIDLDFLDTSGYAILPVATAALPIDARPEAAPERIVSGLELTMTLDEREAGEGQLALEVKATARGPVPALDALIDPASEGFSLAATDGGELNVIELDGESDVAAALTERSWTLRYQAEPGVGSFAFPAGRIAGATLHRQRYDDADMVAAGPVVSLTRDYGRAGPPLWAVLGAFVCVALLALAAFKIFVPSGGAPTAPPRFAVPAELTPFTVINLLRRMREDGSIANRHGGELDAEIARLEAHYFGKAAEHEPDLEGVARDWVQRAA